MTRNIVQTYSPSTYRRPVVEAAARYAETAKVNGLAVQTAYGTTDAEVAVTNHEGDRGVYVVVTESDSRTSVRPSIRADVVTLDPADDTVLSRRRILVSEITRAIIGLAPVAQAS